MDIQIKKCFSKDVDKIQDKKVLNSIFEIITQIQQATSIKEIKHVKNWKAQKNTDYRLGLCIEDKTVFIVRFLHRKEIYRYFP